MEDHIECITIRIATHVYTMHAFFTKKQNCIAYVHGPCHAYFLSGYYKSTYRFSCTIINYYTILNLVPNI